MGQAVPEIPLSVGSKLELLLRAFVFAKFLYTSPYTHAFVRVCYCRVYTCRSLCVYILAMYMTEAPRVLHFSAFIVIASGGGLLNRRGLLYSSRQCAIAQHERATLCNIYLCIEDWLLNKSSKNFKAYLARLPLHARSNHTKLLAKNLLIETPRQKVIAPSYLSRHLLRSVRSSFYERFVGFSSKSTTVLENRCRSA